VISVAYAEVLGGLAAHTELNSPKNIYTKPVNLMIAFILSIRKKINSKKAD
jgi:hypothetical protein